MQAVKLSLIILSLLFAVIGGIPDARGSEYTDEDQWGQALESYQQGDYGAAAVHLQKVIKFESSRYKSAAWFLLGKCYLHLGMFREAEETAQRQICLFPYGRYAPFSNYTIAQIEFLQGDFVSAAYHLLTAAQTTRDDDLNLLARSKLERLFEIYLNDSQKDEILTLVDSASILAELTAVRHGSRLPLKVGVILPLSGPMQKIGQDILDGIELALAEARRKSRLEVEMISRDSGGDLIEAVKSARSLIHEERVIALIGDLEADCAAAVAATAAENRIPLIIPATQAAHLSEIGENVFQLLTDYESEGAAAAAYALREMNLKKVAILAPANEDGIARVRGFQNYFENAGMRAPQVQWYYRETTDFKRLLEIIADIGRVKQGIPFVQQNEQNTDSLQIQELNAPPFEQTEPVNSPLNYFDALYIPVEGDELSILAPQIAAAGFSGTLIGSSNCLDLVTLAANQRYVEGMIFPSNFASYQGYIENSELEKLFQGKMKTDPNRWNVLGWDALNFIAAVLKGSGKSSPEKIVSRLSAARRFAGIRMEMVFPSDIRVNQALYVLKFSKGRIEVVESPVETARLLQ
jgi:branched-chain amino acid transport system substrate-binding protein